MLVRLCVCLSLLPSCAMLILRLNEHFGICSFWRWILCRDIFSLLIHSKIDFVESFAQKKRNDLFKSVISCCVWYDLRYWINVRTYFHFNFVFEDHQNVPNSQSHVVNFIFSTAKVIHIWLMEKTITYSFFFSLHRVYTVKFEWCKSSRANASMTHHSLYISHS